LGARPVFSEAGLFQEKFSCPQKMPKEKQEMYSF
jgi:hypothetical protein